MNKNNPQLKSIETIYFGMGPEYTITKMSL